MNSLKSLSLVLLLPFAFTQWTIAQSNTNAFSLGIYLNGTALSAEDVDGTDTGGGLGVRLAYGFTPAIEAFADLSAAAMTDDDDDYGLGFFDIGIRYNFAHQAAALRPFVDLAYTGRAASFDFGGITIDMRGTAISLGGGLRYFFSPNFAFESALRLSRGEFSEARVDNGSWTDLGGESFSSTTTRINLGIAYFF
jgi:hypothetical protein